MHNHLQPNVVKLSLVSKEMRALAMDLYYKENAFEFSREESECWDPRLFRFPQPHIAQMLRRVEVHIYFDTSFSTLGELFELQNSSTRMSWVPEDEPRDDDEEDDEYPEESRALKEWVQSEECQRILRREQDQLNAHYYRVMGRENKDDKLRLDLPTDILMLVQPRRAERLDEQPMMPQPHQNGTRYVSRQQVIDNHGGEFNMFGHAKDSVRSDPTLPRKYYHTHERRVHLWSSPTSDVQWQKGMSNLQHVKIVVAVESCLGASQRKALEGFARETRTLLRAAEFEVVVEGPRCAGPLGSRWVFRSGGGEGVKCDGKCKGIVKRAVEDVLRQQ
jgi:hypothetical protein